MAEIVDMINFAFEVILIVPFAELNIYFTVPLLVISLFFKNNP